MRRVPVTSAGSRWQLPLWYMVHQELLSSCITVSPIVSLMDVRQRGKSRSIKKRTFPGDQHRMAEAKPAINRPLSPHLSIYRMQINMFMSIVHRITGTANYVGMALFAAWLISAAMGPRQYARTNELLSHPIGLLVLFGYTWSVLHHMLGGVRHFIWDTGRGFSIPQVNLLSWLSLVLSLSLTVAVWALGLSLRGVI